MWKKKRDMSVLSESKLRGPWFRKGVETWGVKCAILKIGGPKSQACETWRAKSAFKPKNLH